MAGRSQRKCWARMIEARRQLPSSGTRWTNVLAGNLEGLPRQRLAQLQAAYDDAPVGIGFLDRHRIQRFGARLLELRITGKIRSSFYY